MAVGAILVLIGVFLVARTVTHDDAGHNLVDRILGAGGSSSSASTSTATRADPSSQPPFGSSRGFATAAAARHHRAGP